MATKAIGRQLIVALAGCMMALACWLVAPSIAWADEVSDAQAVLAEAEEQMAKIASEYDELVEEIEAIQEQISQTTTEAIEIQQAVNEGRDALAQTMRYEYRGESSTSWLMLLLCSEDFSDFLRNLDYVRHLMSYQADEIEAQKERKAKLDLLSAELHAQKDEQEEALAMIEGKKAQAEQVLADASARLANAKAAEAERLAALEEAVQGIEPPAQGDPDAEIDEDSTTIDREDAVPGDTPVAPNPEGTKPGNESEGWLSGIASAYGGATDPYTDNPSKTATGAICDDNSMGVAVPMSMPNYRSYFGRTVEICYNGMTVYAVVNDCGGLNGGSRVLDLQPGVWRAFGFDSCSSWGLRTVTYRFL